MGLPKRALRKGITIERGKVTAHLRFCQNASENRKGGWPEVDEDNIDYTNETTGGETRFKYIEDN